MRMKSTILVILALLFGLCLPPSSHAQLLSHPYIEDKQPIIQAVLEAELLRQNQMFEGVTQLSYENLCLIPALEISGKKIIVLDASKIGEQVKDGNSNTYWLCTKSHVSVDDFSVRDL
jgi:hypothetical protein